MRESLLALCVESAGLWLHELEERIEALEAKP